MTAWPENGEENWNTKMAEFVDVEHDADGTHDLSIMGNMKVVTFTKDLSDTDGTNNPKVITDVGFEPGLILFFGSVAGNETSCWGADDGTASKCIYQVSSGSTSAQTARSLRFDTATSANQTGYVTATSSVGFSVTWARTAGGVDPDEPTGMANIIALCFK